MPHPPAVLAWYLSGVDPLAGSQWSASDTVAGFAKSAPNAVLMKFAEEELRRNLASWTVLTGMVQFNVINRGIILRGADLPEAWLQLLKLAGFLTVMLLVAVVRFKKRLD